MPGIWETDANHSDNVASQADVGYEKLMDCDVRCGVVQAGTPLTNNRFHTV